jgi:hypothetical protein
MSRWKKLDHFDAKLEQMTAEELRAELSFWKKRANELAQPGKNGTMKIVFKVQKVLDRKLRDQLSADEGCGPSASP